MFDDITRERDELVAEARDILDHSDGALEGADEERYLTIEGRLKDLSQRHQRLEQLRQLATNPRNRDHGFDGPNFERGTPFDNRPQCGRGPQLSRQDEDIAKAFQSALKAKNPAPIEVWDEQPRSWYQPGVEVREHGGILTRDTLKSTATQGLGVSVYPNIVQHMVENSSVMAAGATVITTPTGEDLVVPKSTTFVTSALTSEGASISESDPTLAVNTLKAYKYASFFQISRELADDTPTNLLQFLANQAGQSLALAFGPHLITGTGSGQPQGVVTASGTGVTGPTGTATSLGTQATAGQGTDLLYSLIGSLAEPYARSRATGFVLANSSLSIARKLKDSAGQPVAGMTGGALNAAVGGAPSNNQILGYPAQVDPFVATMAANAKSIVFGDWSRYFIRVVNGIRFERSDEFAFQNDLVSFKAVIRLDGALIDANATKLFVNSAT